MIVPHDDQGCVSPSPLSCALIYAAAGLAVIPIRADGSKQPALPAWKPYQDSPPTPADLEAWFAEGKFGLAIVCGKVSGNLAVLDFDTADAFAAWRERVQVQAPGLLSRLPVVASPRPGRHVYFRSAQAAGGKKLARSATGGTLIELKGNGGYVLAPGSPAGCHPSGKLYEHFSGPPLTATPQLTAAERSLLLDAARSLDAHRVLGHGHAGTAVQLPGIASQLLHGALYLLTRARAYLARCDPAVSGQGGHNQTYKVAVKLVKGFGLDSDTALALLLSDYNPKCSPPWSEKELRHKVEDAARANGETGYLLPQPAPLSVPLPQVKPPGPGENGSSLQAPQGGGTIWKPIPISQLQRVAAPDTWVWEGILAPGKITLLSAEAKAGKTTLLSLLYQGMASGGSLCGAQVWPGRAVVVSEEPADFWLERRERLGLGDHLEVLPMPFMFKPSRPFWERMIAEAVRALKQQPAALVVLDTLSHLWWVDDENDNAREAAALMPLRQLSAAGAALAIVHHFGAEKAGPRGGTELRGFPDVLADLHLYRPNDFIDRRRTLKVRGRLQAAPSQLVIELNAAGDDYTVAEGALLGGTPGHWAVLTSLVPGQPPGWSAQEFRQHWPSQPPPEAKRLNDVLAQNWEPAGWQRTGTGTKNNPYRFWHPQQGEK
jgi:putative DNA primase/helicase